MAASDKKITDLQLISEMTDSVSIPGDNAMQTYRVSGPKLYQYINKNKYYTVVSKTTTYTATLLDEIILCSTSAAWTLTLPAAASSTGKRFVIKKISSDFNALTIDGNASETIDGQTTTTINTQFECLEIICDGSNWHIIDRVIPSEFTSYTPTVSTGVMGSGATNVGWWMRDKDSMIIRWMYRQTNAGTAGSGNYLISIPSGVTVDSGKVTSGVNGGPTYGSAMLFNGTDAIVKTGFSFVSGNTFGIIAGDATNQPNVWSSTYVNFANTIIEASAEIKIPITGWKG